MKQFTKARRERPWSDKEHEELREWWRTKRTLPQIAAVMERSERGVIIMADRLGLSKRKNRVRTVTLRLTDDEMEKLQKSAETHKTTPSEYMRSLLILDED